MNAIRREQARLTRKAATVLGGAIALTAFLCLAVGSSADSIGWLASVPQFCVIAVAIWLAGSRYAWFGTVLMAVTSISIAITLRLFDPPLLGGGPIAPSAVIAITVLLGGAVPAVAMSVMSTRPGAVAFVAIPAATTAICALLLQPAQYPIVTILSHVFGWSLAAVLGAAIIAAVPPAFEQIGDIARAHRIEREASELSAQRRHSARLLHDTVLATLTMLAHSGVGVDQAALRTQAANDSLLLRQLRTAQTQTPLPGAPYSPAEIVETTLADTLAAMRGKFAGLGLDVKIHGQHRVLLPPLVLDALLLAVTECLENIRRHSGVSVADVTITHDESAVRAMVTDSGVGFEIGSIDSARLGIKESVLGRLESVGGRVRIFSSPGAGTTVLLEVPL